MFVSDLSFKSFVGQMWTNERPRVRKKWICPLNQEMRKDAAGPTNLPNLILSV